MASTTVEERLTKLEQEVARLAHEKGEPKPESPWWESISGTFANSPDYDEAMKLGRVYRESLRPSNDTQASGKK